MYSAKKLKLKKKLAKKVKQTIKDLQINDSNYKFLLDVRAYMEQKVGALEFPEDLLKTIMKANNKDKDEKYVEDNFVKSLEELKWHLIKEQLVKANDIKVEDKDLKATAIRAARFQFAQYGMNNIPDEYLENYASGNVEERKSGFTPWLTVALTRNLLKNSKKLLR